MINAIRVALLTIRVSNPRSFAELLARILDAECIALVKDLGAYTILLPEGPAVKIALPIGGKQLSQRLAHDRITFNVGSILKIAANLKKEETPFRDEFGTIVFCLDSGNGPIEFGVNCDNPLPLK